MVTRINEVTISRLYVFCPRLCTKCGDAGSCRLELRSGERIIST